MEAVKQHRVKRVIFSINTGRSGSKFISTLCEGFANVSSFHEPYPALCGSAMMAYQLGDKQTMNELMEMKVQKIKKALQQKPIYFESNHYFIKGFGWEILDHLKDEHIEVGIVVLKRDPEKIVNSFYKIGTSLIGQGAINHLIHPEAKIAREPFFKNPLWDRMKLFFYRVITLGYNLSYYMGLRKLKSFSLFKGYQKRYLYWYIDQFEYLKKTWIQQHPQLTYLEIVIGTDEQTIVELMQRTFGMEGFSQPAIDRNSGEDYVELSKKK